MNFTIFMSLFFQKEKLAKCLATVCPLWYLLYKVIICDVESLNESVIGLEDNAEVLALFSRFS